MSWKDFVTSYAERLVGCEALILLPAIGSIPGLAAQEPVLIEELSRWVARGGFLQAYYPFRDGDEGTWRSPPSRRRVTRLLSELLRYEVTEAEDHLAVAHKCSAYEDLRPDSATAAAPPRYSVLGAWAVNDCCALTFLAPAFGHGVATDMVREWWDLKVILVRRPDHDASVRACDLRDERDRSVRIWRVGSGAVHASPVRPPSISENLTRALEIVASYVRQRGEGPRAGGLRPEPVQEWQFHNTEEEPTSVVVPVVGGTAVIVHLTPQYFSVLRRLWKADGQVGPAGAMERDLRGTRGGTSPERTGTKKLRRRLTEVLGKIRIELGKAGISRKWLQHHLRHDDAGAVLALENKTTKTTDLRDSE